MVRATDPAVSKQLPRSGSAMMTTIVPSFGVNPTRQLGLGSFPKQRLRRLRLCFCTALPLVPTILPTCLSGDPHHTFGPIFFCVQRQYQVRRSQEVLLDIVNLTFHFPSEEFY